MVTQPLYAMYCVQDCEFTYLSTQVLHLLGLEGPHTKDPAKYIRYIYNRVILENATVRAAAVSSLAQFGALVEDLRPRIQILLQRALHDNDDEVHSIDCLCILIEVCLSCCFDMLQKPALRKTQLLCMACDRREGQTGMLHAPSTCLRVLAVDCPFSGHLI